MPAPFKIDPKILAEQLRKPEGAAGEEVGEVMAQRNLEPNAFAFQCLKIVPTDRVLEIGFGPGVGIAEAARQASSGFVAGIDHSGTMLRMAEERNRSAIEDGRMELRLGDAAALPFADESFDKLFSVNVLHFWKEPARELAECLRVLKQEGRAVFFLTHPTSWAPGTAESGLFVAREAEEVAALLEEAGFRGVANRTFTMAEDRNGFAVWGTR